MYLDHFQHADDIIQHLSTIVPSVGDPLLKAKYAGFVSVAAVTVYELAIKDIFIAFANKKHNVFGFYTENQFDRINGQIKISHLRSKYIQSFGVRYLDRFDRYIEETSKAFLSTNRRDVRSSYGNIITWRHEFAHQGRIAENATYNEAVQSYEYGKQVIHCLARVMVR